MSDLAAVEQLAQDRDALMHLLAEVRSLRQRNAELEATCRKWNERDLARAEESTRPTAIAASSRPQVRGRW